MIGEVVLDWFMENIMVWLIILIVVGLIIAIPFAIYEEYTAEKFYLRKDQWTCSASVERAYTTYIQSGSTMIPITNYQRHCTQWTEKTS